MKKYLFLATLLYAFSSSPFVAKSQKTESLHTSHIINNTIHIIDFDMCPVNKGFASTNTLLLKESAFLSKFGKPKRSTNEYSQMDDAMMKHIIFTGAEAWYLHGQLETLIFTNPNYKFVLSNGKSIKVGDPISMVKAMFPKSWAAMNTSNQVFVQIENSNGPVDCTILFEFDPEKGIITSISTQ
jgi:hypothetical protein